MTNPYWVCIVDDEERPYLNGAFAIVDEVDDLEGTYTLRPLRNFVNTDDEPEPGRVQYTVSQADCNVLHEFTVYIKHEDKGREDPPDFRETIICRSHALLYSRLPYLLKHFGVDTHRFAIVWHNPDGEDEVMLPGDFPRLTKHILKGSKETPFEVLAAAQVTPDYQRAWTEPFEILPG